MTDHKFVPCDLERFCDRKECRHEFSPGQVCGRTREEHEGRMNAAE